MFMQADECQSAAEGTTMPICQTRVSVCMGWKGIWHSTEVVSGVCRCGSLVEPPSPPPSMPFTCPSVPPTLLQPQGTTSLAKSAVMSVRRGWRGIWHSIVVVGGARLSGTLVGPLMSPPPAYDADCMPLNATALHSLLICSRDNHQLPLPPPPPPVPPPPPPRAPKPVTREHQLPVPVTAIVAPCSRSLRSVAAASAPTAVSPALVVATNTRKSSVLPLSASAAAPPMQGITFTSLASAASAGKRKNSRLVQASQPEKKRSKVSGMTSHQKKTAKKVMAKQKMLDYVEQLPVWLVPPAGRTAISDAAVDMVLTTEFGKKYKDVLTYR